MRMTVYKGIWYMELFSSKFPVTKLKADQEESHP